MILQETYKLENGTKIPKLGLGTWCIDNDKAAQTVRTAVTLGYRLIDTAQAYKNEQGVGEGIRSCSVPREELFVASKVAAELKTYEAAATSIEETLENGAGLSGPDDHPCTPAVERIQGHQTLLCREQSRLACAGGCAGDWQGAGHRSVEFSEG